MTHKIRGVDVEKYAYYVNKLLQNVGLETLLWRQIVTSQTVHTEYKWPPHVTAWNPPMKIFCVRHCSGIIEIQYVWQVEPVKENVGRLRSCAQHATFSFVVMR